MLAENDQNYGRTCDRIIEERMKKQREEMARKALSSNRDAFAMNSREFHEQSSY